MISFEGNTLHNDSLKICQNSLQNNHYLHYKDQPSLLFISSLMRVHESFLATVWNESDNHFKHLILKKMTMMLIMRERILQGSVLKEESCFPLLLLLHLLCQNKRKTDWLCHHHLLPKCLRHLPGMVHVTPLILTNLLWQQPHWLVQWAQVTEINNHVFWWTYAKIKRTRI